MAKYCVRNPEMFAELEPLIKVTERKLYLQNRHDRNKCRQLFHLPSSRANNLLCDIFGHSPMTREAKDPKRSRQWLTLYVPDKNNRCQWLKIENLAKTCGFTSNATNMTLSFILLLRTPLT